MIYLDNSATTPVLQEAADCAMEVMTQDYFNPSSLYAQASKLEKRIKTAREFFAKSLRSRPEEIVFTSGATESNNIAIFGTLNALRASKYRFITTKIEHPAVYEPFWALEQRGHEVIYLSVDENGKIDLAELASLIDEHTALVSIMQVNNEVGTIQDISSIGKTIKQKNPQCLFHSDGVQGFGKCDFDAAVVDLYSISGHKFHAPKGVGLLMMRNSAKNMGGQMGGGQERNLRSGTLNAPGILAMAVAAEKMAESDKKNMLTCKKTLYQDLCKISDVYLNGPDIEEGAPQILNLSFMGLRGEVLLHALEARGVLVSTGSACASHKKGDNRVLNTFGYNADRIEGAIRFSFGRQNKPEEMHQVAEIIEEEVKKLRRFKRR